MDRAFQTADTGKEWVPPDGLGYTRMRPVRLTGAGIALVSVGVLMLLGALAAGIGLGIASGREYRQHRLMREQGVLADAEITRLWRARDEDKTPHLAYTFMFQEREYKGSASAPLRVWKSLAVGSRLPVRFLPANPASNRPEGWQDRPLSPWVPCLAAAFRAGLSGLVALPLRRQARLLSEGRAARGVVTAHRKTKDGTVVRYEFAQLSGAMAKGRSGPRKGAPAVGESICVLYNPEEPRRNAPYPLTLVKLANRGASGRAC